MMIRTALFAAVVLSTITSASAQFTPKSGMLLGIYAFPNYQGLRVTRTIPGYSAHGTLFRDDVLMRVTADGVNIFETRSLDHFEFAKDQIGPNRPAALELFRPGQGLIHLWVEFRPVGGGPGIAAAQATNMEAKIWSAREKPGAERLFQQPRRPETRPRTRNQLLPKSPRTDRNAGSLFGK